MEKRIKNAKAATKRLADKQRRARSEVNVIFQTSASFKVHELMFLMSKKLDPEHIIQGLIEELARQATDEECDQKWARNIIFILEQTVDEIHTYVENNHK